jgi:radical SAM protein with 4Fe4S-binding SPASM domain
MHETVIVLRPTFRVFRSGDLTLVEALHTERATPVTDVVIDVLRHLRSPVEAASELHARLTNAGVVVERSDVHGALSLLSGLGLIATQAPTDDDARALVIDAIARGMPDFPLVDQVELTNICPMTCVMCPTGTGAMTRPKGRMSEAIFTRLVDEIVRHDVQRTHKKPLTLHNLGESLLHPDLPRFIAYARERGLETEVAGNPGHLTPELYAALCDAGLTRLVLDVDGLDQETLESIRGKGARGDRAFIHLEHVLEMRAREPARGPSLVVQMIRQQRNASQCDTFLEVYRRGLARTDVYVKALDANTRPADDLVQIGGRTQQTLCRAPYKSVVVLWDGTVVPCCHDENGALSLGSLETSDLETIWTGHALSELRARMRTGALSGTPCGTCAHRPDRFPMPKLDEIPDEPLAW